MALTQDRSEQLGHGEHPDRLRKLPPSAALRRRADRRARRLHDQGDHQRSSPHGTTERVTALSDTKLNPEVEFRARG